MFAASQGHLPSPVLDVGSRCVGAAVDMLRECRVDRERRVDCVRQQRAWVTVCLLSARDALRARLTPGHTLSRMVAMHPDRKSVV